MQEGCWAIVDTIIKKRMKARGQDTPKEWWKQPGPPPQHTTLKSEWLGLEEEAHKWEV